MEQYTAANVPPYNNATHSFALSKKSVYFSGAVLQAFHPPSCCVHLICIIVSNRKLITVNRGGQGVAGARIRNQSAKQLS